MNYTDLMQEFLPRPIDNIEYFNTVQKRVDELLDQEILTNDENDYLHV